MGASIDPNMVDHIGALHSFMVKVGLASTSQLLSVVAITLFVTLLFSCIVIGHTLEESRWMNESIPTLMIGLCTGVIVFLFIQGKSLHILLFSEEVFFFFSLIMSVFLQNIITNAVEIADKLGLCSLHQLH